MDKDLTIQMGIAFIIGIILYRILHSIIEYWGLIICFGVGFIIPDIYYYIKNRWLK